VCKTPWRNFCQSWRKIYLSRRQELSRADSTKLVNGRKAFCHDKIVEVRCKNCDKLIAPTRLLCFRCHYVISHVEYRSLESVTCLNYFHQFLPKRIFLHCKISCICPYLNIRINPVPFNKFIVKCECLPGGNEYFHSV